MRETLLRFAPPAIGEEEIAGVVDTLRSGWITTGPKTKQFEKAFGDYVGASAALAVNSATAALHCGLAALGVGPGDVVITTPMTFVSCAHVIEQVGARAVFVDVQPDTLNIDPDRVEEATKTLRPNERLAAILPVHLYGHPCDRTALLDIAARHNCALMEDAAHAFPCRYNGTPIGADSDLKVPVLTAFSFYATKNLSTGEGGMLTGPRELIEEAQLWSLHGMSRDAWKRYGETKAAWFYEVARPGFKDNMTDIQAEAFAQIPELEIPTHRGDIEHAWHIYALRLNNRNDFINKLMERKISSSVHFIPIHLHAYYRDKYGYKPEDFPVAAAQYERLVSLPIYPAMTDDDVEDVIEAVIASVR
jgi:dTDP-4-amino-4,6-dideoxygalactose transaminase